MATTQRGPCKGHCAVGIYGGSPGGVDINISRRTAEFTVRAVDAAGVPIAFTWACHPATDKQFHVTAGETWTADRLALDGELKVRIVSAAGSLIEVELWGE